jgi:hypothetical protein
VRTNHGDLETKIRSQQGAEQMSEATQPKSSPTDDPIVVDLGKHSKKKIKALCKGSGDLMDEVSSVMGELQRAGTLKAGAQPLIVVVKEKRKKSSFPMFLK